MLTLTRFKANIKPLYKSTKNNNLALYFSKFRREFLLIDRRRRNDDDLAVDHLHDQLGRLGRDDMEVGHDIGAQWRAPPARTPQYMSVRRHHGTPVTADASRSTASAVARSTWCVVYR